MCLSDLLTLTLCFDSFLTAFDLLLERINTLLLWRQWLYRLDGGDFYDEHSLLIKHLANIDTCVVDLCVKLSSLNNLLQAIANINAVEKFSNSVYMLHARLIIKLSYLLNQVVRVAVVNTLVKVKNKSHAFE